MGCRRPWEERARVPKGSRELGVNLAAHGLAGEMGKRERQKLYLQAREPLVGLSCPFPNSNLGHLLGYFFFFFFLRKGWFLHSPLPREKPGHKRVCDQLLA